MAKLFIGTAGWSIGTRYAGHFPPAGTHLQRYGARLDAVEINSSIYRPHRRETYERWAASVPAGFRFSVKLPKAITHERRLAGFEAPLDRFMAEVGGLGDKLGVLLVQMPPSLRFEERTAAAFFQRLVGMSAAIELDVLEEDFWTLTSDSHTANPISEVKELFLTLAKNLPVCESPFRGAAPCLMTPA